MSSFPLPQNNMMRARVLGGGPTMSGPTGMLAPLPQTVTPATVPPAGAPGASAAPQNVAGMRAGLMPMQPPQNTMQPQMPAVGRLDGAPAPLPGGGPFLGARPGGPVPTAMPAGMPMRDPGAENFMRQRLMGTA
jgi:hypothetical protein